MTLPNIIKNIIRKSDQCFSMWMGGPYHPAYSAENGRFLPVQTHNFTVSNFVKSNGYRTNFILFCNRKDRINLSFLTKYPNHESLSQKSKPEIRFPTIYRILVKLCICFPTNIKYSRIILTIFPLYPFTTYF